MAKPAPLSDDDLKALAGKELRAAVAYFGGKLSDQRRKAEIYYLGEAKLDLAPPEVDGRSTFVATVVRNTIMSMKPQLMAKFVGSDQVVQFEPAQKGDEQKAQQCTDYLNYLFMKRNNGHAICSTWFDDALLQKNGIIKCWWDTTTEETRESYKGLSEVELAEIMDDEEVEPIEQESYPDEEDAEQRQEAIKHLTQQMQQAMQAAQQPPPPGPAQGPPGQPPQGNPQAMQAVQQMQQKIAQLQSMPPAMLYDVSFRRSKKGGKLVIDNVPPEEFLISREAKTIGTARMVGHRFPRTLSQLRSMGYKNVDNIAGGGDDSAAAMNAERIERLGFDDEMAYMSIDNTGDDSQSVVWVNEMYIRCDYDGDGIAELRKVTMAGNQLLDNEEVDAAPFISITPVPMAHKFFGMSIADLAMESQKTMTQTIRAKQDNLYLQVNGRYFAVNGQVNLDDLLTSRPGGIVRVDQPGAVGRLDQGQGDMGAADSMMEWLEMDLEQRTGWTRYSQGNDSKALNQTATGVQIITNKGDMRVDLIARHFAEGFVELFRMMLKLVSQHQDKATEVRIGGEWVDMDPREWRNQFDVNINVGLGIGSKDEQIQKLMAILPQQAQSMAIGVATPKNVYNLHADIVKLMGHRNPDDYFNDPEKSPPPQKGPPPEIQVEQMKLQGQMQIEQMKLQAAAQAQQIEVQSKQAQTQIDAQSAQQKIQADAQLAAMKSQYDEQASMADRQHEAQLEQMRAQMQAQVDMNRDRSQADQKSLEMQQEAQLAQLHAGFADQAHGREQDLGWQKAQLDSATKIEVANIASKSKLNDAATAASTNEVTQALPKVDPNTQLIAQAAKQMADAATLMSKPKTRTILRDKNGKATGMTEE